MDECVDGGSMGEGWCGWMWVSGGGCGWLREGGDGWGGWRWFRMGGGGNWVEVGFKITLLLNKIYYL